MNPKTPFSNEKKKPDVPKIIFSEPTGTSQERKPTVTFQLDDHEDGLPIHTPKQGGLTRAKSILIPSVLDQDASRISSDNSPPFLVLNTSMFSSPSSPTRSSHLIPQLIDPADRRKSIVTPISPLLFGDESFLPDEDDDDEQDMMDCLNAALSDSKAGWMPLGQDLGRSNAIMKKHPQENLAATKSNDNLSPKSSRRSSILSRTHSILSGGLSPRIGDIDSMLGEPADAIKLDNLTPRNKTQQKKHNPNILTTDVFYHPNSSNSLSDLESGLLNPLTTTPSKSNNNHGNNSFLKLPSPMGSIHRSPSTRNQESNLKTAVKNLSLKINANSGADNDSADQASYYDATDLNIDKLSVDIPSGSNPSFLSMNTEDMESASLMLTPTATGSFLTAPGFSMNNSPNLSPRFAPHSGLLDPPLNDDINSQLTSKSKTSVESSNPRARQQVFISSDTSSDNDEPKNNENSKSDNADNEGVRLFGKSFGVFSSDSEFRLKCRDIANNPKLHILMTTSILIQTGFLTYQQVSVDDGYVHRGRYRWVDWIMVVMYVAYTIEMVLKCIAFGVYDDSEMFKELRVEKKKSLLRRYYEKLKKGIKRQKHYQVALDETFVLPSEMYSSDEEEILSNSGRRSLLHTVTVLPEKKQDISKQVRAYLRSDWNVIDFISILSFWIGFGFSLTGFDLKHQVMIFRSLMCLKILRLLNINEGSRRVLKGLKMSAISSKEVTLFMICFWILFAIIGVQSFKSSLRRHCVWTNPLDPSDTYTNGDQYCGAYILPNSTVMPYILSSGENSDTIKGFKCPVNSRCIVGENPYSNTVSFDNIFASLELVFIVISANTFTDLMYYTMDTDSMTAAIYFICGIVFLKIWLWSLIVAVIINTYKVSMQHKKEQRENSDDKKGESFSIKRAEAKKIYSNYVRGKKYLQKFIQYRSIFVLVILLNFMRQCFRTADATESTLHNMYLVECATTIILLVEIIILFTLFIPRWRIFFYSDLNCFDLLLAVTTSVIILPPFYNRFGKAYLWLTVFQIARFYRVAVLNFTYVKDAWATVLARTKPFLELCLFFVLSLYLIGIIAARLFEGLISTEEYLDSDQLIMYNLPNVMLSLYVISSTENWTSILYLAQECGLNAFSRICVASFLILWFIFSNMVIISIFIAIITDNLDVSETEKRRKQIKQFYNKMLKNLNSDQQEEGLLDSLKRRVTKSTPDDHLSSEQMIEKMKWLLDDSYDIDMLRDAPQGNLRSRISSRAAPIFERLPLYSEISKCCSKLFSKFKNNQEPSATPLPAALPSSSSLNTNSPTTSAGKTPFAYTISDKHKRNDTVTSTTLLQETIDHEIRAITTKKPTNQRVLYLFSSKSRLRRFCQRLVSPPIGKRTEGVQPNLIAKDVFYTVMFLFSVVVVVITCFVTPIYRRDHGIDFKSWSWVTYTDVMFSVIFTIEFAIKVIADGFLLTPNAYLRSTWERIDFFVLITFWCTAIFEINGAYDAVIVVGDFRALRALRLLTVTKASKMHFQLAVVSAIKQITTGALVAFSLLIPFSLYGLILFSDKLGYCLDGSDRADCLNEYSKEVFKWDIVSPNNYVQPALYFDNFRISISTLFQIISLEGWTDLLLNLMNITGAGLPPETFNSPGNGLFVIIFIFISIVFILNLFVSIIINNYAVQTGSAYLSDKQLAWYEVKRVLRQVKPPKRRSMEHIKNKFQKKLYSMIISKNKTFMRIMDFFMFVHIIALVSEAYPASNEGNNGRYALLIISTSGLLIFNLINLYAIGPKLYFKNKWNIYRVFITFGALQLSIFAYITSRQSTYSNINKLFLVGILFLLIPRIDMLNQLLKFASGGLPSLISLLYMWLVIFLVFAIALNQRFGLTKFGENTSHNLNCRTVTKTLIMLFRNSFGEGWNYIMNDFMVEYPLCYRDTDYDSDCGNQGFAYAFFMGWNILSMYVILNILISVVINNFSYIFNENGPHALLTRDELRKFKNSWNKYDPHGTGLMDPLDLQPFLSSLSGILSYRVYGEHYTIPKITNKWITKKSDNPYDIDIDFHKLDEVFACIDFEKVKERKRRLNRLVIEAQMCMVETTDGLRIKFTDLLLLVGYYSRFEDSTCLTLEDFIKRYTLLQKVNKILRRLKIEATIAMVLARLRFKINNTKLLSTDPVIRRAVTVPEILTTDEHNSKNARSHAQDPYNPFENAELYRSVSRASLNPFHDQSSSSSSLHIPTAAPAPYDDVEFKRRGTNTP